MPAKTKAEYMALDASMYGGSLAKAISMQAVIDINSVGIASITKKADGTYEACFRDNTDRKELGVGASKAEALADSCSKFV